LQPYAYWPPTARLAGLLRDGAVGELSSLRVQAVLGRGWGPGREAAPRGFDDVSPLREAALLLCLLGGPVKAFTALCAPEPSNGGLVACAFERGAWLGGLEFVRASELAVETEHAPLELSVEAAGTDGFVLLRRGPGRRTHESALLVRVGRDCLSLGGAEGLDEGWEAMTRAADAELAEVLAGRKGFVVHDRALVSALRLTERVPAARDRPEWLRLPEEAP
jgi:hypothetical protein